MLAYIVNKLSVVFLLFFSLFQRNHQNYLNFKKTKHYEGTLFTSLHLYLIAQWDS